MCHPIATSLVSDQILLTRLQNWGRLPKLGSIVASVSSLAEYSCEVRIDTCMSSCLRLAHECSEYALYY